MFMVKEEYANTKNLLKVKMAAHTKNFIGIFIVAVIMTAGSLGSTVFSILKNNDIVRHQNVSDLSVTFFGGTVFGVILLMFQYRPSNAKLSVFPQTNNSRFISSMMINNFIAVIAMLTVLVMYLLNLGIVKTLSVFVDNIHFALNVDIGFIIVGFFVYLAYIFIFIAVIELIGAILRKWTYYAAVACIAVAALAIVNISYVMEQDILAFLIRESSLPLFFVKAIGIWLVITVTAFSINRFTVYHKSQNKATAKGILIICVIIVPLITLIVPAIILYNTNSGESSYSYSINEAEMIQIDDYFAEFNETRIDVSHLPRGSNINIRGTNIVVMPENSLVVYNHNTEAVVMGAETLTNHQGDTVVVRFRPAPHIVNGIEIQQYANQQVTAYLIGNTLFIEYTIDSANVVIMPIWGIARQFDLFRDKGIFTAHAFGFSSGWYGSNNIIVGVE